MSGEEWRTAGKHGVVKTQRVREAMEDGIYKTIVRFYVASAYMEEGNTSVLLVETFNY